jgi:hypothetical protein
MGYGGGAYVNIVVPNGHYRDYRVGTAHEQVKDEK